MGLLLPSGERLKVRVRPSDGALPPGRLRLLFFDLADHALGEASVDFAGEGSRARVRAPACSGRGRLALDWAGAAGARALGVSIDPVRPKREAGDEPEPYDPGVWFMPEWFRHTTMMRAKRSGDPWSDYRTRAGEEAATPHPLFETDWYRRVHALPDGVDPLAHFIAAGAQGPTNQAAAAAMALGCAVTPPDHWLDDPAQWIAGAVRRLRGSRPAVVGDTAPPVGSGADVTVLLLGSEEEPGAAAALASVAAQRSSPGALLVAGGRDAATLNCALARVATPLLAPIESGDRWSPDHLASLLSARERRGAAVSVGGWSEVRGDGRVREFAAECAPRAAFEDRCPAGAVLVETGTAPRFVDSAAPAIIADWLIRLFAGTPDPACASAVTVTRVRADDRGGALAAAAATARAFLAAEPRAAEPELLSIIVEARGRAGRIGPTLAALMSDASAAAREVLIVDSGVVERDRPLLAEWARLFEDVRLVDSPCPLPAGAATSVGAAAARGERLVLLHPGAVVAPGWLDTLVDAGARGGGDAVSISARHPDDVPLDDHEGAGELALLMARDRFVALGGLDPRVGPEQLHADLLVRAQARRIVAVSARVTRVAERVQPLPPPPPAARHTRPAPRPLTPTIAIKVSRWDEPHRNSGDLHFASSLATALRQEGATVRVDETRDWYARPQRDEVVLVLRGRWRYRPSPRHLNLLWLISHPDDVSPAEMASFDHVFAASDRLASRARDGGVNASTLLQCTDPALFRPPAQEPVRDLLFVGNSRLLARPLVATAAAERLPLSLHGRDWERFAAHVLLEGLALPADAVAERYRRAIVFNDHWPDMASAGILSNRLFDAAASAAPIVSDRVDGIEMFAPAVHCWDGAAPLAPLVSAALEGAAASFGARVALAERVRRDHSFAARACAILAEINRAGAG